jgi:colanic acid/amylovoran biosynthesis glycosyltransferase
VSDPTEFSLILVLFTSSYPFDRAAEQTFMDREIPHLLGQFHKVTLIPKRIAGQRFATPFEVDVNEDFAFYIKKHSNLINLARKAFSSPSFFQEIRMNPTLLLYPPKILKLILYLGKAALTQTWVSNWIVDNDIEAGQCTFYSYWFDDITMGLSNVKDKFPGVKLVSRAHGYDIYEEQYFPYYWPCRRQTLARVDKLFSASEDGRDYFRNRFPEFYDVFDTAHLGVKDPGFVSSFSSDDVLRIVSCAHILPLKRIDLLSRGIALASRMRPGQKIEWHHFGDGKGRKALREAVDKFPPNATGHLPGYVPNQEIMKHYRENPVDVFVNLSTTEGGAPVSIQEAISCGIPVIATNVGGNPEIVSERNGLLLDPNPTPEEVASALLWFCDHAGMAQRMRMESRKVWQESYNAEVNFSDFAEKLKSIAEN